MVRAIAVVASLFAACARAPAAHDRAGSWSDPARHEVRKIGVGDGVSLEFVDWGGTGPTIFVLAGLGNTAHVFDDFAPAFLDRWHVIGMTRRGYGASDAPSNGYAIPTLGADIVHVLDAVHIDRAILMGHSIAGDEMTWVSTNRPDRVLALIYLDAAYDRVAFREVVGSPPHSAETPPSDLDLANPNAYAEYLRRGMGLPIPLGEVLASFRFDPTGRFAGPAPSTNAGSQIMKSLSHPAYDHVVAPALAIYAVTNPADESLTPEQRRLATFNAGERTRFAKEVAGARVVELRNSKHYVFLASRDDVVHEARGFLSALPVDVPKPATH